MTQPIAGMPAPQFSGNDQNGNSVKLSSFTGKKIVLYFYPKDDTPGCTAEACSLRDNYEELLKKGFVVLGVSPDSEKSHRGFAEKHNLPYLDITSDFTNENGRLSADLTVDGLHLNNVGYKIWHNNIYDEVKS